MNLYQLGKKTRWIKKGSIVLPAYYANRISINQGTLSKDPIIAFIQYSEIFRRKLGKKKIYQILDQYSLSEALLFFSKISLLCYNDGVRNPKLQFYLAGDLFDQKIREKILEIERISLRTIEGIRPIFFPQQALILMKFSLLRKIKGSKKVSEKNVGELSLITLAINDYLDKNISYKKKQTKLKQQQQVFESFISNFELNTSEQFRYLLTRYYLLFFTIPRLPQFRKYDLSIPNIFRKAIGLDLEIYFALGLAILTKFKVASRVKPSVDKPSLKNDYFLLNKGYFRNTKVNKKKLEKLTQEFIGKPSYFVSEFNKRKLDPHYNFFPFICKPLIEINKDFSVLTSRKFLEAKITSGVYWFLHDYIKNNLSEKQYGKFKEMFGFIFEYYINSILKRIYPTTQPLVKQLFFEKKYRKRRQLYKTSDAMIFFADEAVFIEMTTSQMRIETAISGKMQDLQKDLTKIIFDKTKQLDRVISDFKNNFFTVPNFASKGIRKFYPLLVTLKPPPIFPHVWRGIYGVWKGIFTELKEKNLLQQPYCTRLQIIDAEELEMLEPLVASGKSLRGILRAWANDSHDCDYPLKNFIFNKYFQYEKEYGNQYLQSEFHKIGRKFRQRLFKNLVKKVRS